MFSLIEQDIPLVLSCLLFAQNLLLADRWMCLLLFLELSTRRKFKHDFIIIYGCPIAKQFLCDYILDALVRA